ncbi:hypothetical protein STANM309S_03368 [Streptomyces tanashiensis]
MEKYWSDGYRQDCSGYISMAWNLRSNEWTGSLDRFAERIDRTELQAGDILLFHNPANPTRGSHVTIFGGWTDYTHTSYLAYEQTKPRTRNGDAMASGRTPTGTGHRYKGVVATGRAGPGGGAVPGGGEVPARTTRTPRLPAAPRHATAIHRPVQWGVAAPGVALALFAQGWAVSEPDGRAGHAWMLPVSGDSGHGPAFGPAGRSEHGWTVFPRRVDVRLRHWRSQPLSAVDAKGTALDVTVLVVWRVRDTVRAALGVDGHEDYLREQVEAAMARVLWRLPADAFHEDAPTLRDAEAVGEALTRMLSAECARSVWTCSRRSRRAWSTRRRWRRRCAGAGSRRSTRSTGTAC